NIVSAQKPADSLDLSRYQEKTEFIVEGIITPKVLKMVSDERLEGPTLLMKKKPEAESYTQADLMPHKVIKSWDKFKRKNPVTVAEVSSSFEGDKRNLVDGNYDTFLTFDGNEPVHTMRFVFPEITEVSSIYVALGKGILPPKTMSIEGVFEGGKRNFIEQSKVFRSSLSWPPVKVKELIFSITSPHLFRVAEVDFGGTEVTNMKDELVFFAEEGQAYILYSAPQFGAKYYSISERQPLATDIQTPEFGLPSGGKNPDYNDDFDGDGLDDFEDLCPKTVDPANTDVDRNGRGDVCEDPDQDGIMSDRDNCPYAYNQDQLDSDKDGLGDKCDNEENRVTESMEYLLPFLFGLVIIVLLGLVWRSLKKD
ncbi:MAG TPA: thrombospondin type 3 repeat-containing protein, partial [Candidatus Gracilibacteria bacterium]